MTETEQVQPETIKVGSIVHLKSGSPPMTVNHISSGGDCECKWFEETFYKGYKLTAGEGVFHVNTLFISEEE